MAIGGVRLRAIALPVCVAIVSVAALTWYRFMWIPGQEAYLNERNLRTLHTTAKQIKAKVDNFDLAIDRARESSGQGESLAFLVQNVPLLAPELEIIEEKPERERLKRVLEASDPPRVVVQRDEGRTLMYLAYQRDDKEPLYAKADLERTVLPFLSTRSEFEAVFVADRRGIVIVPPSTPGFALARLDRLSETGGPESSSTSKGDTAVSFERLRGTTSVADVTIGATSYKLYMQPIQLSLKAPRERESTSKDSSSARRDGEPQLKEPAKTDSAGAPRPVDEQEEWTLCGLVRADRFRAASSALVTTYWLWLGLALASVVLTIPLLKLRILSPRERLQSPDGVVVAGTAVVVIALGTFSLLDARYFGWSIAAGRDAHLQGVAQQIVSHFQSETAAIDAQMTRFDPVVTPELWTERLAYSKNDIPQRPGSQLKGLVNGPRLTLGDHSRPSCMVPWSCRDAFLNRVSPGELLYPYFDLVVWSDESGWQRIKWSTTNITPFLNLQSERLPYYDDMALARRTAQPPGTMTKGVALVQSPNTGEQLTVFWRTLPPRPHAEANRTAGSVDLAGMSLSTMPLSLVRPVLPKDVQFAVIDAEGHVLHHSDPAKRGAQNLFDESEDNATLRSLALGRSEGWLDARYQGRRHRMFVRSLVPIAAAAEPPFSDPRWTLVVFQETSIQETLNLETLIIASSMFGLYAVALAVLWGVLYLCFPNDLSKWFWPLEDPAARYHAVIIANAALAAVSLTAFSMLPDWRLVVAGLSSLASFGTTFAVVRDRRWPAALAFAWPADFSCARASLLFVVAAVPAIACFLTAYDFESGLFAKARQVHLAAELDARDRRIKRAAQQMPLCDHDVSSTTASSCDAVITYLGRRRPETWDVHVTQTALNSVLSVGRGSSNDDTWLGSVLRHVHRPYNEFAASLITGTSAEQRRVEWPPDVAKALDLPEISVMSASPFGSDGWYWLIVVGLMGASYLFVHRLQLPLFVLNVTDPGTEPAAAGASANQLVLGPPGSGKTRWLRDHVRGAQFLDVRTFVMPKTQRAAALASAAALPTSLSAAPAGVPAALDNAWLTGTGVIDDLALDPGVSLVCVDHLEYRFHEAPYREQVLALLEDLLFRRKCTVWIASARHPIDLLKDGSDSPTFGADIERWANVMESFGTTHLRIDPVLASDGHLHEAVWMSCSRAEKLALRQLADEGLVNPNNRIVLERLMGAGLIRRHSSFAVMNERFRDFVLQAASPLEVSAWEHEGVRLPWGSIATTLLTVAVGLGGLLLLTQEQVIDVWVAYVPTLAPAIPAVMKLVTSVRAGKFEATVT